MRYRLIWETSIRTAWSLERIKHSFYALIWYSTFYFNSFVLLYNPRAWFEVFFYWTATRNEKRLVCVAGGLFRESGKRAAKTREKATRRIAFSQLSFFASGQTNHPLHSSVKLHLCINGYCWRESRAKLLLTWKQKCNSYYENITLEMNKFTENECLSNSDLKFKFLEDLRKPLTIKSTRNA